MPGFAVKLQSKRKKIDVKQRIPDLLAFLSEGNPGGLTVLRQLIQTGDMADGVDCILAADDMNIRGPQLWVAYKDFAKGDLEILKYALKKRCPHLVRAINEEMIHDPHFGEFAVQHGGSWAHV